MNKPETISVLINGIDEYKKIGDSKPRTSMTVNVILSEDGFPLEDPRLLAVHTAAAYRKKKKTIESIQCESPKLLEAIQLSIDNDKDVVEISLDDAMNIGVILRDVLLILKDGKM